MRTVEHPPLESNPYLISQELGNQILRVWQWWINQCLDGFLRNEQFLNLMGGSLQDSLECKQQVDHVMEMTVANLQMPTRREMETALHKLTELENLLHDMNHKLDQLLEDKQRA